MKQVTQKHMDTLKLIKHSAFKKPYLEDGYVPMEYLFSPFPPYAPPNPGDSVIPDCKVGFEAGGILKDWRECAPGNSCAAYIFTCAHKLISLICGNCTITEITPLEGDRLMVIICSDQDKLDIKYQTIEKPSEPAKWKKHEEKRICCLKETVSIGYTSQQMSCSGSQVLTVVPGGGADDCYSWAVTSGGGSLDLTVGNAVTYTAPATNAECANNPTITLTAKLPGGGTQTATLKIAINCHPASNPCGAAKCAGLAEPYAYRKASAAPNCAVIAADNCQCQVVTTFYGCDGFYQCPGGTHSGNYCLVSYPPRVCNQDLCDYLSTYFVDARTACMKTAGCCPAALL